MNRRGLFGILGGLLSLPLMGWMTKPTPNPPFKIRVVADIVTFYCPYIPLQHYQKITGLPRRLGSGEM